MRFTIAIMLIICGCKPSADVVGRKNITMENINLKYHQKNAVNNESIQIKDSIIIKTVMFEEDSSYIQYTSAKNSTLSDVKSYYKSTKLRTAGRKFFDFYIGTGQVYDEDGKMVSEINFENGYLFSVNQLVEKMRKDFNLDILDMYKPIKVIRGTFNDSPVYFISTVPDPSDRFRVRMIIVDGITGKTISDKFPIHNHI